MELIRRTSSLMVVDGLLGDDAVAEAIAVAVGAGFEAQEVGRGQMRARQRAAIAGEALSAQLWEALRPVLPQPVEWFDDENPPPVLDPPVDQWAWVGLNPRLRFYRYEVGAEFPLHVDEPWRSEDGRRSILTVLIYLPSGVCVGGETVVGDDVVGVASGRVALFDHRLPHTGRPVERGSKLVLRTDVIAGVR